jgi:hypothetical protein
MLWQYDMRHDRTSRPKDSEIWFSWNPRRKSDAVDKFLRVECPDNAIVVKANWRDNPWFPTGSPLTGRAVVHIQVAGVRDRLHCIAGGRCELVGPRGKG